MKEELLLVLADGLDEVPARDFNLGVWWCGTAGCALGHGCNMPRLRELGLQLVRVGVMALPTPDFNGKQGYFAVEELFNIDYALAQRLFAPDSYRCGNRTRPKTVARRIRQVVEDHRKERAGL